MPDTCRKNWREAREKPCARDGMDAETTACSTTDLHGAERDLRDGRDRLQEIIRWMEQGAMTVEASFIVPWVVILTALLIVMTFWAHNRNWYRAGAVEAALCGTGRHTGSDGEAQAEERAAERVHAQTMPGSEPSFRVTCSGRTCTVDFAEQTFPAFNEVFAWQVSEKAEKIRPVAAFRQVRAVKEAFEE